MESVHQLAGSRRRLTRSSWRPDESHGSRARFSRLMRRLLLTGCAVLLFGWLLYLLLKPFYHPNTHFVFFTVADYQPLAAPPIAFALEDYDHLSAIDVAVKRQPGEPSSLVVRTIDSPDLFAETLQELAGWDIRSGDAFIAYVAAHGIVRDGKPYLLCDNFATGSDGEGTFPLSNLLAHIRNLPAATKLLVLDTGQLDYDRQVALFGETFPRAVQQAIDEFADDRLCVLLSHGNMQQSRASVAIQRSVFGYLFARGLKGEADKNQDRCVTLGELHDFVQAATNQWFQGGEGSQVRQTPLLLCSSDDVPLDAILLSTSKIPADAVEDDVDQTVALAHSPKSQTAAARRVKSHLNYYVEHKKSRMISRLGMSARGHMMLQGVAGTASNQAAARVGANQPQTEQPPAGGQQSSPAGGDQRPAERKPTDAAQDDRSGEAGAPNAESGFDEVMADAALDANSAEINLRFAPQVRELLGELWKMHDRLADDDRRPHVLEYAPHLWREFEARLVAYEQRHRAGIGANQIELANRLGDLRDSLQRLLDRKPPRERRNPNVIDRIAIAKPAIDWRGPQWPSLPLALRFSDIAGEDAGGDSAAGDNVAGDSAESRVATAANALQEALADESGEKFRQWLSQPLDDVVANLPTFRFAQRISQDSELSWSAVRLAVQTRLLAERTAAKRFAHSIWVRGDLQSADQQRWAGERNLFDRLGADWPIVAERSLTAARRQYQQAASKADALAAAKRVSDELLLEVTDYVDWCFHIVDSNRAPATRRSVATLLETLHKFSQGLESPSDVELAQMLAWADDLRRLRQSITASFSSEAVTELLEAPPTLANSARIEAMLRTRLLSAEDRQLLLENAVPFETRHVANFRFFGSNEPLVADQEPTDRRWLQIIEQLQLEVLLARLTALTETPGLDEIDQNLRRLRLQLEQRESPPADVLWTAFAEASSGISLIHHGLPDELLRAARTLAETPAAEERSAWLTRLCQAERGLRLVAARDVNRLADIDLMAMRFHADWYDQMVGQQRRWQQYLADAADERHEEILAVAEAYRRLAMLAPGQPAPPANRFPGIDLEGPAFVSLVSENDSKIQLSIRRLRRSRGPVWLIVDYDDRFLHVDTSATTNVYRREPGAPLFMPNRQGQPPSLTIDDDAPQQIDLHLRRLADSLGDTKLIVKAVDESNYVRHELLIRLPGREMIQLASDVGKTDWSASADGVVLHPLPNRAAEFLLGLRNLSGRPRSVDVQFFVPAEQPVINLPAGELDNDAAEAALASFGDLTLWHEITDLNLPEDGELVPLSKPVLQDEKATSPAEQSTDCQDADREADEQPRQPSRNELKHGLVAVIRDRSSSKRTVRRIEFAPQRPRRFVRANAAYNSTTEQVEITVVPIDRFAVPADGIKVVAEFVEPLPAGGQSRLQAVIKPPDFEAKLSASVSPTFRSEMTVQIHVDQYPRAFLFRIPIGPQAVDLPELTDAFAIRILQPPAESAYKAPIDSVPATVQVDAPQGAFPPDPRRDFVEIGIDEDRDREFGNDTVLRIFSDRQVKVEAEELTPSGKLRLYTSVSDFQVDVPTSGLLNVRTNLLGKVTVGRHHVWSAWVPVILDGAGPVIESVELKPGRDVAVGEDLEVSVWAWDADLSGVAKVEVGYSGKDGKFSEESPPVEAELKANVRWVAALPTKDRELGTYTVLIRATDRVGNVGQVRKETVRLLPAGSKPKVERSGEGGHLVGTVSYGDELLSGAEVTLESVDADGPTFDTVTTDENGRFDFYKVPPGEYKLGARGVARNKLRRVKIDIAVPKAPASVQVFALQVR